MFTANNRRIWTEAATEQLRQWTYDSIVLRQLPVNWFLAKLLQCIVCCWKAPAAEELGLRQWRWVCSVDDLMFVAVDYFTFLLCKVSPQDEYNSWAFLIDNSYYCICELLPANLGMRVCFVSPNTQQLHRSIECVCVCISVWLDVPFSAVCLPAWLSVRPFMYLSVCLTWKEVIWNRVQELLERCILVIWQRAIVESYWRR